MHRVLLVLVTVAIPILTWGQNAPSVDSAEYFWGTNPDTSQTYQVNAADGSFDNVIEQLSASGLNPPDTGLNQLSVRVKDTSDTWGPLFTVIVYKGSPAQARNVKVQQAEFYWDNNTGSSNMLMALDGNLDEALESVIDTATANLSIGRHTLNVRVKGADSTWSPVFSKVLEIDTALTSRDIKVTQAEYYWDNSGQPNPMVAFDGAFEEALETVIDTANPNLSVGRHTLNLRVKGADGNWSPYFNKVLEIDTALSARDIKVTQAEYYWDNTGQPNPMVAFDNDFDEALETVIDTANPNLSVGRHTLNVRVKGADGNWGPYFNKVLEIDTALTSREIRVKEAEYYWDNNPSQSTMMLAFNNGFDSALETVFNSTATGPSQGRHKLSVRVKGADGNWGPPFSKVVELDTALTARDIKVTAAEGYWDNDPGKGNGIPFIAIDGNFDEALETVSKNITTDTLSLGRHVFYTRAKGADGNWGPSFGRVIEIDTGLTIQGPEVFCASDSLTGITYSVNASGGSTYSWQVTGGSITTPTDTSFVDVDWNTSGPYELSAAVCNGGSCDTATLSISIQPAPEPDLGPDTTICNGDQLTLSPGSGFSDYNWQDNSSDPTFTVQSAGTYAVTVTDQNGCTGSDSINVSTAANPSVDLGNDTTICSSSALTLDAGSGFSSYTWNTNANTQTIQVSSAGTYEVTVTNQSGCTASDAINVFTSSTTVSVDLGPDRTICPNGSITLDAGSGYSSYEWQDGSMNQTFQVIQPGTYSVTVTGSGGCSDDDTVNVNATNGPTVSIEDDTICQGETTTLDAGNPGATYNWSTNQSSQTIQVSSGGTYFVTVTDNGCSTIDTADVTLQLSPNVDLGNDTSICDGETLQLDAGSSGSNYNWSTTQNTQTITVSQGGNYSVTVTDAKGCSATDQIDVMINPLPAQNLQDKTICAGSSTILDAGNPNASSYNWSTNQNGQTIQVSSGGTYSVTVTSQDGCVRADTATVTIGSSLSVSLNDAQICQGDSATLDAGNPGADFQWSTNDTTKEITVGTGGNYSVTVTDNSNCTGSDTASVTVNSTPTADAGSDQQICEGDTTTLTASGGISYQWSNQANTATIDVSPAQSAIYIVTVTDQNGCTDIDSVDVTVNAPSAVDLGNDTSICNGQTLQLDAGSGSSYNWNTNDNSQTITVSQGGSYAVTVTNANNCSASDTIDVTIDQLPSQNLQDKTICAGSSTTLDAGNPNASSYDWSTNQSGQTIQVSSAGTYSVTVSSQNGCQRADTTSVTIGSNLSVNVNDAQICQDDSATLDAGIQGADYQWSTNDTTQQITVGTAGDYSVTVSDNNNCTGSDTATVTVNSLPSADAGPDQTICNGDTATLTASGGSDYVWNQSDSSQAIQVAPTDSSVYGVLVTDSNGCSSTDSVAVAVAPNPTADFSYTANGKTVSFSDQSSANAVNWTWDLNGDTTITQQNPSYTFTTSGQKDICLTVETASGCTDSICQSITLSSGCQVSAAFSVPNSQVCQGDTITFPNNTTDAISYQWLVNGIQEDTAEDLTYQFNNQGNFQIDLIASDSTCSDTAQQSLSVAASPTADFQYTANGLTVDFTDQSSGAAVWQWDFGDGNGSTDPSPQYTFSSGGQQKVCLTVTNTPGCADSICQIIDVTTGIGDQPLAKQVEIFPNPATNTLLIRNDHQNADLTFRMIDVVGKTVRSGSLDKELNSIPVSILPAAVYFVEIEAEGDIYREKVVITR